MIHLPILVFQTPGMFGPAHMTNLVHSRGAVVEAPIHTPPKSDATGCEEAFRHYTSGPRLAKDITLIDDVCPNTNIQIIDRGVCSFMTKAVNQKLGRDCDAMIVINTENDLFTMAGDLEVDTLDPDKTPLAVMISHDDGQKLLAGMKLNSNAASRVIGKINLEAQPRPDELEVKAKQGSPLHFPIVHATEALIQIYAEGYWGVQAVALNNNWNLQLVKHHLG